MTKPVSRRMAVDCLLDRIMEFFGAPLICSVCGQPLLPGQQIQFDHIHSDVMGGEHHHMNLRPIHYDPCHKQKTARDVAANAKVKRILNPKPSKRPMQNSGRKIPSRQFPKRQSGPNS